MDILYEWKLDRVTTQFSLCSLFSVFFSMEYFRFDLFTRECTCFRRISYTHKFNSLINKQINKWRERETEGEMYRSVIYRYIGSMHSEFRLQRLQTNGLEWENERERGRVVERKWNEEKSTKPITAFNEKSKCTQLTDSAVGTHDEWEAECGLSSECAERIDITWKKHTQNSKGKPKRTINVLLIITMIDFDLSLSRSCSVPERLFRCLYISFCSIGAQSADGTTAVCMRSCCCCYFLKSLLLFEAQLFYRQLPLLCHWLSNCDCGLCETIKKRKTIQFVCVSVSTEWLAATVNGTNPI